jgi:hypothetical protein
MGKKDKKGKEKEENLKENGRKRKFEGNLI